MGVGETEGDAEMVAVGSTDSEAECDGVCVVVEVPTLREIVNKSDNVGVSAAVFVVDAEGVVLGEKECDNVPTDSDMVRDLVAVTVGLLDDESDVLSEGDRDADASAL